MSILDISVDLDTETITWPDPCAGEEACLSKQTKPAEWLWTHVGANPRCAQVFCEDCDKFLALMVLSVTAMPEAMRKFSCKACGADNMTKKDLVRRHI